MSKSFKTPKGTELPLIDLKGKPYLQVAHRLVWFREDHPTWGIITEPHSIDATQATFIAQVRNDEGKLIATGTKQETKTGFPDFIEKAETGAIGRALALCGYGTQFAPELDEGNRLADSPVIPARKARPSATKYQAATSDVQRIAELVKEKHGVQDAQIVATLNTHYFPEHPIGSSGDITALLAKQLIRRLEALPKPEAGAVTTEPVNE
jgi:hypothetical protein